MVRKIIGVLLLTLLLTGCQRVPAAPETTHQTQPSETEATEEPAPTPSPRALAYQKVLRDFLLENVWPDGEAIDYDSAFGSLENNRFALLDVDGDGEEELILNYATAPVNAMSVRVYGFDGSRVFEEFREFPAAAFYSGGLIQASWSRSPGLGEGDFWPFTLYRYDGTVFQFVAGVEQLSKAVMDATEGTEGYPAQDDPENAGIVYRLYDESGEIRNLSKSDYDAWIQKEMGSAAPLQPEYKNLTAAEIDAVE